LLSLYPKLRLREVVKNERRKRGKVHSLVGAKKECDLEIRITSVRLRLVVYRRIALGTICRVSEHIIRTTEGIIMVPSLILSPLEECLIAYTGPANLSSVRLS